MVFLPAAATFSLGIWQVYRLQWKLDLIEKREQSLAQPPSELPQGISRLTSEEAKSLDFKPVFVRGSFLHQFEQYVEPRVIEDPKTHMNIGGCHVLTPFMTRHGEYVFINRGFVPKEYKNPSSRPQSLVPGEVIVKGYARTSRVKKPNTFVPENNPLKNSWSWIDLRDMASHTVTAKDTCLSLYVEAEEAPKGTLPMGGASPKTLNNPHLNYAITWFSLGFCLSVMGVLFLKRKLHAPKLPKKLQGH